MLSLISIAALPSEAFSDRGLLPAQGGVYFAVINGSEIAYVGSTWSFQQRWRNHDKAGRLLELGDLRIHYLAVPEDLFWNYVEQDAIETFRPRLNLVPAKWGWRPSPGIWLPMALDLARKQAASLGA